MIGASTRQRDRQRIGLQCTQGGAGLFARGAGGKRLHAGQIERGGMHAGQVQLRRL
jgi:hypothetical protein